jgi:SAM-dependent methyltransferase
MGLGDWFRRTFGGQPDLQSAPGEGGSERIAGPADSGRPATPRGSGQELTVDEKQRLEATLARLHPPRDMHDGAAWDDYWKSDLMFRAMEVGLSDTLASDMTLPPLLSLRGAQTVLCAGNGLSTEAVSLALHGFDVTALDLSAAPAEIFAHQMRNPKYRLNRISGTAVRDDGSVVIGAVGLIDPELCLPMHRSADCPNKGGGALRFVTGDLMNPELCPGPFDVVIERRTLQLFQGAEREEALGRLVARLRTPGVFVSHQHDGGWRPGQARTHFAKKWLESHGFTLYPGTMFKRPERTSRLACLVFSTG